MHVRSQIAKFCIVIRPARRRPFVVLMTILAVLGIIANVAMA